MRNCILASCALLLLVAAHVYATDCNNNGLEDDQELTPGRIEFSRAQHLLTAAEPVGIATADVNDDGILDIVAASSGVSPTDSGSLVLFLGSEDGSWKSVQVEPRGFHTSVAVADFDGDSRLDIAVTRRGLPNLSIYWNLGEEKFERDWIASFRLLPDEFIGPVSACDLNGDGLVDLVVQEAKLAVFLNNGDRSFEEGDSRPIASRSIVAADLDGDGDTDLAALAGGNRENGFVSVLLNRGDGTFVDGDMLDPGHRDANDLTASDLDGDEHIDLVTVTGGLDRSLLRIFLNTGGATFELAREFSFSGELGSVESADLDGDGQPDLVAAFYERRFVAFLNQGAAEFRHFHDIPATPVFGGRQRGFRREGDLDLTDLDGDGHPEIIATDVSSGSLSVWWNRSSTPASSRDCNGNGLPDDCDVAVEDCNGNRVPDSCDVAAQADLEGGTPAFSVAPGAFFDLDNDGDLDAVGTRDDPAITVQLQDEHGQFGPVLKLPVDNRLQPSIAHGDLDRDGDEDIIVASTRGEIQLFFNTAEGALEPGPKYAVGSGPLAVNVVDLDNDGDLDLPVASQRALTVFFNPGNGAFEAPVIHSGEFRPSSLVSADLDRDGDMDLVSASEWNQELTFFFSDGSGSFSTRQLSILCPERIDAADVDADGDVDIVVAQSCNHVVTALYNRGGGTFGPPVEIAPVERPHGVTVEDLDDDGHMDVAVAGDRSGLMTLIRNVGAGIPEKTRVFPVTGNTAIPVDVDGDGDLDLVSGSTLLRNTPGGLVGARAIFLGERTRSMVVEDLDGDGTSDLSWRRSGALAVALNDGTGEFPSTVEHPELEGFPLLAADIDGDAAPDVVISGPTPGPDGQSVPGIIIAHNDGNGAFRRTTTHPLPEVERAGDTLATAVDVDRDGDEDLVVLRETGRGARGEILTLVNDGSGVLVDGERLEVRGLPRSLRSGDLDGDGDGDVVAAGVGHTGLILLTNDGGVFRSLEEVEVTYSARSVAIADFDSDGDLDLAVATRGIGILFNDGDAKFSANWGFAVRGAKFLGAGDFDGDNDVDVAVVGESAEEFVGGEILVLDNGGIGNLSLGDSVIGGQQMAGLAAGDFDGDGRIDLVAMLAEGGAAFSILMNRAPVNRDCDGNGIPDECDLDAGVPDCNQNAIPDGCEITSGRAKDDNGNGVPDECDGPPFHRGDATGEGRLNVSDGVAILRFLVGSRPIGACKEAADADNDGEINISDALRVLRYLFLDGPPPESPGPPGRPCGLDPDIHGSPGNLGCEVYESCESR